MSKFTSSVLAIVAVVLMVVSILSIVSAVVVMGETTDAMANWSLTPEGTSRISAWVSGGEYRHMARDVAPAKSWLGVCEYKAVAALSSNTCNGVPVLAMILGGLAGFMVFALAAVGFSDAAAKAEQNAVVLPALSRRPDTMGVIYTRTTPLIGNRITGRMYPINSSMSNGLATTIDKVVSVYACDVAGYPNHFMVETATGYYDIVVQ